MATEVNIDIDQGATFKSYLTLYDDNNNIINVTGYNFAGSMKKDFQSSNSLPFTCTIENANSGIISINLTANQTLSMHYGRYYYDVYQIDQSNNYTKILEGIATLNPTVTYGSNTATG